MKKHDNKMCCIGFLFRKSLHFVGSKEVRRSGIEILGTSTYGSQYIGLISGSGSASENPESVMKRVFFDKTNVIPERMIKVYEEQKEDGCKQIFYLIVEKKSDYSIYKEIRNNHTQYVDVVVSFHDIREFLNTIDKNKHLEPLQKAFEEFCKIDETFSRNEL